MQLNWFLVWQIFKAAAPFSTLRGPIEEDCDRLVISSDWFFYSGKLLWRSQVAPGQSESELLACIWGCQPSRQGRDSWQAETRRKQTLGRNMTATSNPCWWIHFTVNQTWFTVCCWYNKENKIKDQPGWCRHMTTDCRCWSRKLNECRREWNKNNSGNQNHLSKSVKNMRKGLIKPFKLFLLLFI